ncbi:MAG: F0F1 ATP synthase subunit epsilon [Armatimonadota bacterium]|nr:F0F1 ATP synthase subunit epsilon [Armatimonadota bacterium]
MPGKTFHLEIVTPDRVVLSDDRVASVIVPGSQGYLGVLAGHAPLLAELKVGQIDIRREDNSELAMATSGGFIEVSENKAIILADTAEIALEIDVSRAEDAKTRAEDRLRRRGEAETDAARADAALTRALNRLHVAEHAQG